ncbi:MAG: histidine kinase [Clostridium sp.]|nr:histidine kinase [Clostridium sp.]
MENVSIIFRIRKSLSTRIIWTNAGIILLVFVSLIFAAVGINYQYIMGNEKEKMNVYISNTLSSVDNKLKDMGRVSMITFSDERTQEILREYDSYEYSQQLDSVEYLKKRYTSLISIREDINSIFIFNLDSLIFWQDNLDSSQRKDYEMAGFLERMEEWEGRERSLSGCRMVVGTQPDFMRYSISRMEDAYKKHCIYLVRVIRSFSPYEPIGHIVLITNMEKIRESLNDYLYEDVAYTLLTEEGEIVCSEDAEYLGQNIEALHPEIHGRLRGNSGVFQEKWNGKNYLIAYQKSDYSGLVLMTSKEMGLIGMDAMRFTGMTVAVFLVLLAVAVALTGRNIRKILRPLTELSDSMAHFNQKDMGRRFVVTTEDETGRLMASFNKMMDTLNQLIESEYEGKIRLKEAQLKQQKTSLLYLKNQINPHFLYNTLDTIRIKAELNGDKEVAAMIMQMVHFFRLSVNADTEMVSVHHEIRLIQSYLNLMRYRYPTLNCEYEIDETLLSVEMPNFILQPLVENSVMHGLRQVGYRGTIRLSVRRDEQDKENIVIKVYDNGAGMSPEAKKRLEYVLQDAEKDAEKTGTEDKHIGIVNVQKRLKIYYPDTAGLSYQDNPEGGVTVILVIKNNIEREDVEE